MEVKLLSCTPDALGLLLRTKNTRLRHESDPASWSDAQRAEHLAYMRDTIHSSWEFVDYVFEITGVTRAFTHQLVRTRTGSYAQESQRTVDVSDAMWENPLPLGQVGSGPAEWFDRSCEDSFGTYRRLMKAGVPAQDARGVLPTATHTSIICKYTLRSLSDMAKVRLCSRTQGEYQEVFRLMRQRVVEVHPWVDEHRFVEVNCVATGGCAFPRWGRTSCKFYHHWMDRTAQQEDLRKVFWLAEKQVAVPVAKNGRTM